MNISSPMGGIINKVSSIVEECIKNFFLKTSLILGESNNQLKYEISGTKWVVGLLHKVHQVKTSAQNL